MAVEYDHKATGAALDAAEFFVENEDIPEVPKFFIEKENITEVPQFFIVSEGPESEHQEQTPEDAKRRKR